MSPLQLDGERKLRIADVSRGSGLSRYTVSSLYNETVNRVDLDTIDALCKFLDIEVGELFVRVSDTVSE